MSSSNQKVSPIKSNPDIDIGLACLFKHSPEGKVLNIEDIAEVCGVSKEAIHKIERRALIKLKIGMIKKVHGIKITHKELRKNHNYNIVGEFI